LRIARFRTGGGAVYAGRVEGEVVVPKLPGDGHAGRWAAIDLAMASKPIEGMAPIPLADVRLLAPVPQPGAIRDFYAFESHVATARRARGLDMDPDWYELPVFYFSNPHTMFGPDDPIPSPRTSDAVDYELEVAALVGRDCSDVTAEEAAQAIAGYTIFNDWSARDLQRREMAQGLGPAKGKDFASSSGPWLVTPDELPGGAAGRPEGAMVARVNGEEWSRDDMRNAHWSFAEMLAYASRDSVVRRGDLIGSGTCGTGCILELAAVHGPQRHPWLRTGDTVELEVERIGVLRNTVA